MADGNHDQALAALRAEALERGYVEGLDFYVQGFHATFSSELVLAVVDDSGYRVAYRDMGKERDLLRSADVQLVTDEFFAALTRLRRGVEPDQEPAPADLPPLTDAEIVVQFLRSNPGAMGLLHE